MGRWFGLVKNPTEWLLNTPVGWWWVRVLYSLWSINKCIHIIMYIYIAFYSLLSDFHIFQRAWNHQLSMIFHDGNSVLSQPGQWHEVKSCYRRAQLLIHPHIFQNNHNARHNEIFFLSPCQKEIEKFSLTFIQFVIHLTWLVFPKVCQNQLKEIDGSPNYTENFRWPRPKIC